jgi:hypothetical protein
MTTTSSNNTKLPLSAGDSVISDTIQLIPARLLGRNILVNPDMFFNQRAASYTITGTAANPVGRYTLDGWYVQSAGPTLVVSQQTSLANSYWMQVSRSSGSGVIKIGQTVTLNDCRGSYSNYLSAQLQAFCGSGFSYPVTLKVFTGTGSSDVNNVASTTPFTNQATVLSLTFTPSTVQTAYKAASSLTGSTVTQLSFELSWTASNAATSSTDIFYMSLCQLEKSTNPTPYERVPFVDQYKRVQQNYRKSYSLNVYPGTASAGGGIVVFGSAYGSSLLGSGLPAGFLIGSYEYEPMYKTPTVTTYSYAGTVGRLSNGAGTDLAANSAGVQNINEKSFTIYNNSGATILPSAGCFEVHFTCEAVI